MKKSYGSSKKVRPINADGGGCSKTVLAGYYKYGVATLLGETFGTTVTIILEIDEEDSDKHDC